METSRFGKDVFDLAIEANTRATLKMAGYWARIIAIIAFVSTGLIGVEIVLTLAGVINIPGKEAELGMSLLFAIISIALALFLYKFANQTKIGIDNHNQQELNAGLHNLRVYFKFFGIIIIVALVLFFLMMVIIIVSAGSAIG